MIDQSRGFVPKLDHPFFVVSPPYTRISAGITVLHLLCHYLNVNGEKAFILHYPPEEDPRGVLPSYAKLQIVGEHPGGMIAPLATQDVLNYFDAEKVTSIVIYPEVFDNVFKATVFGRYVLNYPGLLSVPYVDEADLTFAYSQILAKAVGCEDTLYMCTADLDYWNTKGALKRRYGSCYYAGKRQAILGRSIQGAPEGSIQIQPRAEMSRDRVRELFWQSEAFYCYEDSALATEAILCGCPVIWVKNQDFSGAPLATEELGWDGACLLDDTEGLVRARDTVGNLRSIIKGSHEMAMSRIPVITSKLKAAARAKPYSGPLELIKKPHLVYFQGVDTHSFGARPGPALIEQVVSPPAESQRATGADKADQLAAELELVRSSTSWKITYPYRWIGQKIKSLLKRTS